MKFLIRILFFAKGPKVKTSINLPQGILDGLAEAAEKVAQGNVSALLTEIADQYLIECYKRGIVKAPVGDEKALDEFIASQDAAVNRAS